MIKIGLTGPTGAGKSTAAAAFAKAGIPVVDADVLARQVTETGAPALTQLAQAFGADVLREDGSLDRAMLAKRAFADAHATARLNAITHPAITALLQQQLDAFAAAGVAVVAIDAPLLFEAEWDAFCDLTVAVLASPEKRLERIMRRDGLDENGARSRMEAQPDERFYLERAGNILYNDDNEQNLQKQLAVLLAEIGRWCV